MNSLEIVLFTSLLALAMVREVPAQDRPAVVERPPSGQNLALRKSYTYSVWPTVKFWVYERRGLPLPDTDRLLTDGELATHELFVLDNKAVIFGNATTLEIVVDLDEAQPIGEIWARHEGNAHRAVQPLKEEYYVSDDGETFYKVAELKNTWDPPELKERSELSKYFKGVKLWSSGPIRTKGRYVMIKTYPMGPNPGGINPGHISCDEIGVMRGPFDIKDVHVDTSKPYVPSTTTGLPSGALGYRYAMLPWSEIFREGPLFYALNPYELLLEKEYHLSVGGAYILSWFPVANSSAVKTDIEFESTVPASVEVLSTNSDMRLLGTRRVQRDGGPYIHLRMTMDPLRRNRGLPPQFLVVTVAEGAAEIGPMGRLYFEYRYKVDGKAYKGAERSIDLVLEERITAPQPKELVQGMWYLRMRGLFSEPDKAAGALVPFYRDLGFNQIWGSIDADACGHARRAGMVTVHNGGTTFAGNGFTFAVRDRRMWKKVTPANRFQFHPEFAGQKMHAQYALCPTVIPSPELFPLIKEQAEKKLATTDWIEENWEPHMFEKRGCVCKRCRRAFQEFSGLAADRVEALWPDCVIDMANDGHNRFVAHQMAQAMLTWDRAWREASRELGRPGLACYVPAVRSLFVFTPDSGKFTIRGANEYLGQMNALTIWGVPFSIKLGRVHLPSLVGQNLTMLPDIRSAITMADEHGRRENGRRRPRVFNMSGIQFGVTAEGKFVMPKVFYFQTVLSMLEGLDGHASYREYGVDARFMRLRAKAARIMATYEKHALYGKRAGGFSASIVSPVPKVPGRDILYSKSYVHDGLQIIALGNDYHHPIFVDLTTQNLPHSAGYRLVDRINAKAFGGKEGLKSDHLQRGVTIDVPGKEFRILEVRRDLDGLEMSNLRVVDDVAVRRKFERQRGVLAAHARSIEAMIH